MTVLADTSIWVDFFRRGSGATAERLTRLLRADDVVMCGPVVAELLAGTSASQRETVSIALSGLPWAEIDRSAWVEAGELAHALRSAGASVPLLDLVIAGAAVRADAALWTEDRDFQRVKTVLPGLQLYRSSATR